MEGDLVYTLSGHTSFVYSVSVLLNGDIISGGEDRTVRVWRGECHSGLAVQRLILEVHRWRMRTDYRPPSYIGLGSLYDAKWGHCHRL